ncbi:hypothetical protein ASPWEDRAFT_151553 [Aspergillus wentii DTO 134E9]|uniref:AB hydrolase-1 domain-containing protein n=1 Tax=Aspergillus wentii DTO 134E9 TaxID=1073089 RepID=A0A1L9RMV8_ASPWE|nr:uncharacterized protein ASPWEDRAFT_151553 [Aspergillus wentii DTO 134E9]KAI9923438.1 hypothetical protein MW887_009319 [Aspergillus wentii]OJJ36275.1 hypothetical protein ASPWEDRAFT_151553 [Aspergillus wentii DTO 134E9]
MLLTLAVFLISLRGVAAVAHERTYFYVGGSYELNSSGAHVVTNQTYVEKLTPAGGASKEYPIVFVHGDGQTGTNWLNKPDGGDGWASYFLSQGYECYILDQTFRGRSPWTLPNNNTKIFTAEDIQERFTAPQKYRLWPQAHLHTQWNGSGLMGDSVFDTYYSSVVPSLADEVSQEFAHQETSAKLLDRIGKPVILVGHSQGGLLVWLTADARPHLIHSVVAIEPTGPPFHDAVFDNLTGRAYGLANIPITYSPPLTDPADFSIQTIKSNSTDHANCSIQAGSPAPRQLAHLSQFPVLVVTTESSFHAPYDWCTVRFLQQAGVNAEHLELAKVGIHGNGHMVFMEKNSDNVAGVIEEWMSKN